MKNFLLTLMLLPLAAILYGQEPAKQEVLYDQYGNIIKDRKFLSAEARNGILVFESKSQDYKLWLDVRVQADAQFFFFHSFVPKQLPRRTVEYCGGKQLGKHIPSRTDGRR